MFADELIKGVDWDRPNRWKNEKYPSLSCRVNDLMSNITPAPDWNECSDHATEWASQRFWEDLNGDWVTEGMKERLGKGNEFEIISDDDGYILMAKIPLYELLEERQTLEEDIERNSNDEDIPELIERIEEIDEEIVLCAKQYDYFREIVEDMKHYFDEYVWVWHSDRRCTLEERSYFEDFAQEDGSRLWSDVLAERKAQEELNKTITEEVKEDLWEETIITIKPLVKGVKKEGLNKAKNSLFDKLELMEEDCDRLRCEF